MSPSRPIVRRTAVTEALAIFLIASMLGFGYGGLERTGVFRSPSHAATTSTFLTFDEAFALYRSRSALFVDARHSYDFGRGHIPGAVNLPLSEFSPDAPLLSILPRNTVLITYCDGAECNSSVELAVKLSEAGYTRVKVFFGGWNEWNSHAQPTSR